MGALRTLSKPTTMQIMPTMSALRATPQLCQEIEGAGVLLPAGGGREVIVHERRRRDATMVFAHETMQIMKAGHVAELHKLWSALAPDLEVVPLCKKPESMWEQITVGRASTADVVLSDPAVSNVHAQFILDQDDQAVSLEDLGSSNGTFINRERLHPHVAKRLQSGDCVRFGQTIFYFASLDILAALVATPPPQQA